MSTPTYKYRDANTGLITELTEDAASVFPDTLTRVSDDAKPYVEGMFNVGATDYEALQVTELKDLLVQRGLTVSGNKPDLIIRLIEDDAAKRTKLGEDPEQPQDDVTDVDDDDDTDHKDQD